MLFVRFSVHILMRIFLFCRISLLTALVVGALSFPDMSTEGRQPRNHQIHHNNNYSEETPWLGRGGYTTSNSRGVRQRWLRDPAFATNTNTGAVVRLQQKSKMDLSNFFKSNTVVADGLEKIEYGVIDGDLVLPSRRALPPIVEELSYLDYLKDSGLVVDAHQAEVQAEVGTSSRKLEMALFLTYACNSFALTVPVILMPMVAAEHSISMGPKFVAGMFIAAAASTTMLGGGVGKVVNGFVCQRLGGRQSASLYLVGMGIFSLLLSIHTSAAAVGWILAGLEFCASMQWTAHSILLVNHYEKRPIRFAAGMTTLSMASVFGIILAKVGGPALLQYIPSWRVLARIGAGVAVMGGLLAQSLITEWPEEARPSIVPLNITNRRSSMKRSSTAMSQESNGALLQTFRHVLGSRLFWQAGVAHALTSMARTSEKVLGSFFQDTTALSGSLSGGLTAFLTLGFLHGVTKGKKFHALQDAPSKSRMLRRAYTRAVLSAVGLALCANKWLTDILIPSKMVLAGVAALLSAAMASSLSIQYYQIPTIVSNTFGENKAVCLSLLDALAFFLSAPFLAATGQIVGRLGDYGWSTALTMLATLFFVGGLLLVDILPRALEPQPEAAAI
jgi:MFS family permease